MKRTLCVVLVLLMLLPLAACGGKFEIGLPQKTETTDVNPLHGQGKEAETTETPEAEPAQEPAEEPIEGPEEEPKEEAAAADNFTLQNEVVLDNEYATLTIVGFVRDEYDSLYMKVLLENKTADKNLIAEWDRFSSCGYMMPGFWAYEEVAAGKKLNTEVQIDEEEMEIAGIPSLDELQFHFTLEEKDEWEYVTDEMITVYPTGKKAEEVSYRPFALNGEETVLYEDGNIRFLILDKGAFDEYGNYRLPCFIENLSDKNINVSLDDVSLNGFMVDPFFYENVNAGKWLVTEIRFRADDLQKNGIEGLEEIEMLLEVEDYDNWSWQAMISQVCTFRP